MAQTVVRMAGPALVTNAAATKYTVPAGTKAKIQNIHVSNPGGGSAATFTCSIGADAAGTRIIDAVSIPAGSVFDMYGPFYLAAAETIQALSGTNNVLTLTIDGIEYTP